MANAWRRIGYGRFENMAENAQTGYGTPVELEEQMAIAPETIVPEEYEESPETEWLDEDIPVERPKTDRELRYELQESKRAAKIQVDQKIVLLTWLIACVS